MALNRGTPPDDDGLRRAVAASVAKANHEPGARVLAVGLPLADCDPLVGFARLGGEDRFFWEQGARGLSLAGRGAVVAVEAEPRVEGMDAADSPESHPIVRTGSAIAAEFRNFDAVSGAEPLFVGGFGFDGRAPETGDWEGFPPGRMVVPEILLRRQGEQTRATVCVRVEPGADADKILDALAAKIEAAQSLEGPGLNHEESRISPLATASEQGAEYRVKVDRGHAVFNRQVDSALAAIQRGEIEKTVLARSLEVLHPGRFGVTGFLDQLRALYPHCTVLACGRGEDTLVAASPELLVSLEGGSVKTCALAGSAARGRSPEEDTEWGNALRESKKEQAEHEAVVRAIRAGLADWVGELEGPEAPDLMRFLGIQHLSTPLRGRLLPARAGASILDLVACLHPTPAVAGLPRNAALHWIRENEGLDRGWYAAPIGWVDAQGAGEFWLALRSALIRNAPEGQSPGVSSARLFAGAGIVEGSRPEAELAETRLKLRALLAPLTEI